MVMTLTRDIRESNVKEVHVSVWLEENRSSRPMIYYCSKCRYPVLQHQGEMVMELPGTYYQPVPIIVQCKGRNKETGLPCGRKYHFHSILRMVE